MVRLTRPTEEPRPAEMPALFFLSLSVIGYELLLMRIFSVLMWYHFASLAIGLAMLGLGGGGLAAGLFPRLARRDLLWQWVTLFGVGVVGVLAFLLLVHNDPDVARTTLAPFHQPFYKPFSRPETTRLGWGLAVRLAGLSVGAGWPFFFAGLATTALLRARAPRIGGAYAVTFLGSAAGAALMPLFLSRVPAPAALGYVAAVAVLGAAWLARSGARRLICALLTLLFVGAGVWTGMGDEAEIPFARGRYDPDLLAVEWNAMSRVAAYTLPPGETERPFGQSRSYRGEVPRQIGLVVDDSGYTNMFEGRASRENPEYFRANLVALPYHLRADARALLFGPGGGKDAWIALSFPGTAVTAVEINPQVVSMVEETFATFTGKPYSDPRVNLRVMDARRFAAVDRGTYDVIEASAVFGRMPPAAGAFTLSEDLLHTLEGFHQYWDRLSARGILSITRFAYEQRALRLAAIARTLLEDEGVADPGRHIRVVIDRGLANILVAKAPFTAADDAALAGLVEGYGFERLYPPAPGRENQLTRIIDAPDLGAALAEIPFDVSPPTDDRPFFYYTVRPGDFVRGSLPGRAGFDDRGAEVLRAAFGVIAALSVVVLLVPVLWVRGLPHGGRVAGPLVYFSLVGLGYMILEIAVMKRLFLLLGHPVYAVSATLVAFLTGSGLGALFAERMRRAGIAPWLVIVAVLAGLHAVFGPQVSALFMEASAPVRFAVAGVIVFLPAFFMGVAFPAAIGALGDDAHALLPWAWAVNGAASVTASLGAVLLAMNLGYTVTFFVAAALYLAAALLAPSRGRFA